MAYPDPPRPLAACTPSANAVERVKDLCRDKPAARDAMQIAMHVMSGKPVTPELELGLAMLAALVERAQ